MNKTKIINNVAQKLTPEQEQLLVHLAILTTLLKWLPSFEKNDGIVLTYQDNKAKILFFEDLKKNKVSDPVEFFRNFLATNDCAPPDDTKNNFNLLGRSLFSLLSNLEHKIDQNTVNAFSSLHKNLPEKFPAILHTFISQQKYQSPFQTSAILMPKILCEDFLEHHKIDPIQPGTEIFNFINDLHLKNKYAKFKNLTSQWEKKILSITVQEPQKSTTNITKSL